jgi:hypothetical protein
LLLVDAILVCVILHISSCRFSFFHASSPSTLPPVMPAMPLDEDKRRDSRRDDAHHGQPISTPHIVSLG